MFTQILQSTTNSQRYLTQTQLRLKTKKRRKCTTREWVHSFPPSPVKAIGHTLSHESHAAHYSPKSEWRFTSTRFSSHYLLFHDLVCSIPPELQGVHRKCGSAIHFATTQNQQKVIQDYCLCKIITIGRLHPWHA